MAQRAPLLPGTGARAPSHYAQAQAQSQAHAHSRSSTVSSGMMLNGYDSSPAISNGPAFVSPVNGHHDSDDQQEQDNSNDQDNEDSNGEQGESPPKANGAALSRHGFDSSEETLRELESRYFLYYTDVRPACSISSYPYTILKADSTTT